MTDTPDAELLEQFARNGSEPAFAALVQRHIGLVHSVALRHTTGPQPAQDITQAVFIILARKAGTLGRQTILPGWLYHTARLTAANWQRVETRRIRREQEAFMQSTLEETTSDLAGRSAAETEAAWRELAPQLDDAMARLSASDRDALVLRYFQNQSLAQVGAALGVEERTAQKRVSRALEKLRKFFSKRGVTLSAVAIAGAVSANSVSAAPAGLVKTISVVAFTKGAAAGGSTLALVKGALKLMAWTKMKTAIVVGVLLAAGTTVVVEKAAHPGLSSTNLSWADDPKYWKNDSDVLMKLPPVFILRPTRFPDGGGGVQSGNEERISFKNVSIQWLLAAAYAHSENRMVFPDDLPPENFDLMFTLPADFKDALQRELKRRFGLVAHHEKRVVDVLVAKVKMDNPPGLKVAIGSDVQWIGNFRNHILEGQPIDSVIQWLEPYFKMPVLNQTGLTNRYDMTLKWKPRPGQSEKDAIEQMLLNQLGLELVPGREPVDMLVVGQVK